MITIPLRYVYINIQGSVLQCTFLSVLAIEELACARVFMLVSTAGHIALFPLLYQPAGNRCCNLSCPHIFVVLMLFVW